MTGLKNRRATDKVPFGLFGYIDLIFTIIMFGIGFSVAAVICVIDPPSSYLVAAFFLGQAFGIIFVYTVETAFGLVIRLIDYVLPKPITDTKGK